MIARVFKFTLTGIGWLILWGVLIGFAVFAILPFLWAFTSSFKNLTEIFHYPPHFFPTRFDLANYIHLFQRQFFGTWYINSITLSITNTLLVVFFSSAAGFAFARYTFPFKNFLFTVVLGSVLIPFQLIMTPLYAEMNTMGWLNSYRALIIPWIAPAFGIFLMRQYMLTIPSELLDAARMDGCSEFRTFLQIVMPLSKPALGALSIYQFMNSWNSFLWPMIVLRDIEKFTLPLGLATLLGMVGRKAVDYGMVMAGAFLVALPIIILFLLMQRTFISGLTMGAVK